MRTNNEHMDLQTLKAKGLIRTGRAPVQSRAAFPFGLAQSGLHELAESQFGEYGALTGFALAAARQTSHKTILWISTPGQSLDHGRLWQASLADTFYPMPQFLFVHPRKAQDVLWCAEEGLHSGAISLVIAEVRDADFKATRRLTLASHRRDVPVLLLMPYNREGSTAAYTRWRLSSCASAPNPFDAHAPGKTRWNVILERCRAAPDQAGQNYFVEMDDETLSLRLLPGMVSGQVASTAQADKASDIAITA